MMGRRSILRSIFFLPLLLCVPQSSSSMFDKALQNSLETVFKGGKPGRFLKAVAKDLDFENLLRSHSSMSIASEWDEPKSRLFCATCSKIIGKVLTNIEDGTTSETIGNSAKSLCINLGIGNDVFCNEFVDLALPELTYIFHITPDLTANDICGTLFVAFGCVSENPERDYSINLPNNTKPDIAEPPLGMYGVPTLKVLHLADTHIDPEYSPGSDTQCPEKYLCCREWGNGTLENPDDAAGFWGDYRNCDTPIWTLDAIYQHISTTHTDIDFILWTGDLVPHDVWSTSRESNIEVIRTTSQLLQNYFPDTPVFPSVGNHEGNPVNSFPQPYINDTEFDVSWLYDELYSVWSYWLPEDVAANISYSAFYSTQIRPGLKIISVNSQYCYGLNWWLLHDSHDVGQELETMAAELQKSEDITELVYIIGHIPPGNDDCHYTWSREYNKIVSRYEDTIVGLFYGHTHKDHFHIFFEPGTDRAYDIGYIAQSQTPYSNLNPGYKIYTVEGDYEGSKFRVLDHQNWILDLDDANTNNVTNFFKLYSARDEYSLPDLSPQSWYDFVNIMAQPNSTEFDTFYRNYVKAGRPALESGCGTRCKSDLLCRLLRSDSGDESHCDGL